MSPLTRHSLARLAALGLLAAAATAQATFDDRGPGSAGDLTPDGQTVVGYDGAGAWLWTEVGGFVPIGGETAVAVSDLAGAACGNRAGTTGYDGPALWVSGSGWQDLGGLPGQTPPGGSHGSAYDISGDGMVVVGLGWLSTYKARGFRWDAANNMVELPQMGPNSSRASAISGDGQWIGGFDEHSNGTRRAALWDASLSETLFLARPANPEGYGEIMGINSDGSVICGKEGDSGYVWRNAQFTNFGQVPGVDPLMNYNWAAAVSEDGSVAVGGNWDLWNTTTFATIWTEATGVMFVSDYLTALGVTGLDQYQLANSLDISADGTTILGWGVAFPFTFIWWTATIPACTGGTATFCVAAPNSVGSGALIASNGKVSVFANAFELSAAPVPNTPGIFFYGSTQQAAQPFGDGFRCVGGGQPLFRLPVELASGNLLSHELDFTSGSAAGRLLPGTTWHFQAWYRDVGAGYNLSDGLTATFCH